MRKVSPQRDAEVTVVESPRDDEVIRLSVDDEDQSNQKGSRKKSLKSENHVMQPLAEVEIIGGKDAGSPEKVWGEGQSEIIQKSVSHTGVYCLCGLLFLSAMAIGGWFLLFDDQDSSGVIQQPPLLVEPEFSGLERIATTQRELREAKEYYENLEKLVATYYAAKSPQDLVGMIRDEERVMPLIEKYAETHPFEPKELVSLAEFHSYAIEAQSVIILRAAFKNHATRPFMIFETEEGMKFDWEAECCYQPTNISEYIESRSLESAEFRVYAQVDNFYAFEFSDEERYLSLKLTFRDHEEHLYGYLERDSVNVKEVVESLGGGMVATPLYVKVRFLEGRSQRSVLVEEIVSKSWVLLR